MKIKLKDRSRKRKAKQRKGNQEYKAALVQRLQNLIRTCTLTVDVGLGFVGIYRWLENNLWKLLLVFYCNFISASLFMFILSCLVGGRYFILSMKWWSFLIYYTVSFVPCDHAAVHQHHHIHRRRPCRHAACIHLYWVFCVLKEEPILGGLAWSAWILN